MTRPRGSRPTRANGGGSPWYPRWSAPGPPRRSSISIAPRVRPTWGAPFASLPIVGGSRWQVDGSCSSTTWRRRARHSPRAPQRSWKLVPSPSRQSRSPGSAEHRDAAPPEGPRLERTSVRALRVQTRRYDGPARVEVDVRTIIKGKNYDVPEPVRESAERKLGRLERLLDDRSDATVELSVEQHRSTQDSHIVDVTLMIHGQALRSSAAAPTHQAG